MAEHGEPIRIGVRELRGKLGDYLRQAKSGARFLIVSRGQPVAELGAPSDEASERRPRRAGLMKGQIWIADDFDEWPPDILESFEKPL
jgi:antitoxin (DNA-binding transcriptional repressor) of toxin-antitoxin stability system